MEKRIIDSRDFNIADTLDCGQCFRWDKTDKGYVGVACGKTARLSNAEGGVLLECSEGDFPFWEEYFDLKRDYGEIKKAVSVNSYMEEAVRFGGGIRILKQEFFETLLSFIISQRSSIAKIKSTVKKLCEKYGEEIEFDGETYYSFPTPDMLTDTDEASFRALGVGYRAPYLADAVRRAAEGEISASELAALPTPEARKRLLTLYGVGDKVCDCVLLFSLGKYDLFPSDVWIKRVMAESFGAREEDAKKIGEEIFAGYSGFAQQYLFHYRRNGQRNI
ncbi:MAG: 8-oxoguanine DNA glycosylase [Clostridia bacterium]|nr:8-oxoguanine DNA glycosylase [Clostridia bacterium]